MKMRAKLLTISILLLLTVAIFSQTLITPIAGVEYPAIYVDPLRIENTTYVPTTTEFTVYITTNYTDASDIWGYEFTLSWNPFVLNCTDVVNGDLIVNETHPATFSKGTIDNNAGTLNRTGCLFDWDIGQPINTTGGPGILANVTFKVVDWGDSDIAFGSGTFLIGGDGTLIVDIDTMPNNIGHGYFCNVDPAPTHDIIVTNVSPNLTKVLAPTPVGINVTVLNNGTVPEGFTVKVYYDTTGHGFLIGETLVDKLANKTDITLHFPWDTTDVVPGVEKGNHTIIAIAKPVVESKINPEVDKDNNRNETARVMIYSPTIAVMPESTINPDSETYSVSIYTDYNATEVVGHNDIWGYELTLSWNASILEGVSVTNGGSMPYTDKWMGDNSTTVYNTTFAPMHSETVTVNGTKMTIVTDYTINPTTGAITFTTAPDWVLIEVDYWYNITLMPFANFTTKGFEPGKLKLTKNNYTTLVSGPGVLATVTFNVTDNIGESDIVLGNETVLFGYGSRKNITMPHRLKKGYFTNMGDAAMTMVKLEIGKPLIKAYQTWTVNFTVTGQNVWGAPNFTIVVYYTIGTNDTTIGSQAVTGLNDAQKTTVTIGWNLAGVPLGEYLMSAKVVVPTGDHDPLNDNDADGTVKVKKLGDVDDSGVVNVIDILTCCVNMGSVPPKPMECDINGDGTVNVIDILLCCVNMG